MTRLEFRAWFSALVRREPRVNLRRPASRVPTETPWSRQPLPQRRRGFW